MMRMPFAAFENRRGWDYVFLEALSVSV